MVRSLVIGKRSEEFIEDNYILNLNQAQKTIDLSTLPSGDYSVILVCDGQYVDIKTISKL